jgi:streptogramin lyase
VLLGGQMKLARYKPSSGAWTMWDIGVYPHSVALDRAGRAWFNGHFTRDPALIGFVSAGDSSVRTVALPAHPTLAATPGGPIPYELRVAPDGRIWMSELQGNRLIAHTPGTSAFDVFEMPLSHSGPRRFDIDAGGIVWIPAYAGNALVRLDPATREFTTHSLPVPDAVPYVVRVDGARGRIWVGTSAADAVFSFDPASRRWSEYPLPSRGALVRHLAVDPRSGDVWLAYGASPGIPARVARLSPR